MNNVDTISLYKFANFSLCLIVLWIAHLWQHPQLSQSSKSMVYFMENATKMDNWGVPPISGNLQLMVYHNVLIDTSIQWRHWGYYVFWLHTHDIRHIANVIWCNIEFNYGVYYLYKTNSNYPHWKLYTRHL